MGGGGGSSPGSGSKSRRTETNPDLITDREPVALPSHSHQTSPTATQTTGDKGVRPGCTKPGDQPGPWSRSSGIWPLMRLPLALLAPPLSTAHVRTRSPRARACRTRSPVPEERQEQMCTTAGALWFVCFFSTSLSQSDSLAVKYASFSSERTRLLDISLPARTFGGCLLSG